MHPHHGLRHIVLCTFHKDTSAEHTALLIREFSLLKDGIPGIRHFEYGPNISPEGLNDGLEHCFTISFDGPQQRDAYLVDPVHLRFVDLLKPSLAKLLVVDYAPG